MLSERVMFFLEFQLMVFALDNNFLSLDQDTNRFFVQTGIKLKREMLVVDLGENQLKFTNSTIVKNIMNFLVYCSLFSFLFFRKVLHLQHFSQQVLGFKLLLVLI